MNKIRYISLGDSYTIGEGAEQSEAWPSLLTNNLNHLGIDIELIANPSVTGWTTQDLIDHELPVFDALRPDFASLLIGVNDWVQEIPLDRFKSNFTLIVDHIQQGLPDRSKLVLVTIPDFGVAPKGSQYGKGRDISGGLTEFNQVIFSEAAKRHLSVVDIFPMSKRMGTEARLVAEDGVHGSADMYAAWEQIIRPVVFNLLKNH